MSMYYDKTENEKQCFVGHCLSVWLFSFSHYDARLHYHT